MPAFLPVEIAMDIKTLARELTDLEVKTGYRFENGAPFCEALDTRRAEALLHALLDRGYVVTHPDVESPSISAPDGLESTG